MSGTPDPFVVAGGSCCDNPETCANHQRGIVIALSRSENALREAGGMRTDMAEVKGIVVQIRDRLHEGDLDFQSLRKDTDDTTAWQKEHDVDTKGQRTRWQRFWDGVGGRVVIASVMGAWGLLMMWIQK